MSFANQLGQSGKQRLQALARGQAERQRRLSANPGIGRHWLAIDLVQHRKRIVVDQAQRHRVERRPRGGIEQSDLEVGAGGAGQRAPDASLSTTSAASRNPAVSASSTG